MMEQSEWEKLSPEQKKKQLYLKQKKLLDTCLEHHAISQEQYDKSFSDLTEKMHINTRVHKLCQAGRVPGVSRFGRSWVIPADAEKPCDPRKNNRNESQREWNDLSRRM